MYGTPQVEKEMFAMERDQEAYTEGSSAWVRTRGDVCKAHNPHPRLSRQWFSWNDGWNSNIREIRVNEG